MYVPLEAGCGKEHMWRWTCAVNKTHRVCPLNKFSKYLLRTELCTRHYVKEIAGRQPPLWCSHISWSRQACTRSPSSVKMREEGSTMGCRSIPEEGYRTQARSSRDASRRQEYLSWDTEEEGREKGRKLCSRHKEFPETKKVWCIGRTERVVRPELTQWGWETLDISAGKYFWSDHKETGSPVKEFGLHWGV